MNYFSCSYQRQQDPVLYDLRLCIQPVFFRQSTSFDSQPRGATLRSCRAIRRGTSEANGDTTPKPREGSEAKFYLALFRRAATSRPTNNI